MEARIGVISPYPEFTDLVQRIAREIRLNVRVAQGVLANGVAVARQWEAEGIQVAVGRGPTAVMMRKVLRIPVVMITITAFDVLDALHRARRVGKRIAFADYDLKDRQYDLDYLAEMLQVSFQPLLYQDLADLRAQINAAARQGFDTIVGTGSCIPPMAEEKGMRGILVHSSREAIHEALVQARDIVAIQLKKSAQAQTAQAVLDLTANGVLTLDARGRINIFNRAAERFFGVAASEVRGRSLDEVAERYPFIKRLVGDGSEVEGELVNAGGGTYVVSRKPIQVEGQHRGLVTIIQEAHQIQQLEAKIRKELSARGLVARYSFADIQGESPAIRKTVEEARRYARSDLTILITGPSGTGKELFAQSVHQYSSRAEGPFVAVNCAALPENLLESELFGYEEGAFTGARRGGAQGLFELAYKGTLFLDEIGEMPINLQARLLRALQERVVRRVGGHRVIPVDVRVIAATNRDLGALVREGKFREDLYYRLNVLHLALPPLRERLSDLPVLVDYFLARIGCPPMPAHLCNRLQSYDWPGNVRELENFLQKYAILSEGAADPGPVVETLLEEMKRQNPGTGAAGADDQDRLTIFVGTLEEMERQILTRLDAVLGHDRTRLARRLGISRTTLWKKLKEYSAGKEPAGGGHRARVIPGGRR